MVSAITAGVSVLLWEVVHQGAIAEVDLTPVHSGVTWCGNNWFCPFHNHISYQSQI